MAFAALSNKDVAVTAETWHRCLGHRSFDEAAQEKIRKGVIGLEVREVLRSPNKISKTGEKICSVGTAGRQQKEAMTGTCQKTVNLLEFVHSDVCGPMQVATPSGDHYFATFIDEASGRLAVALLRTKGEVFDNFIIYRRHAEKDTGKKIRNLRSDGGGEYINERFTTYLREAGMVKQTTPPYTPAHNAIAERANRTIVEMAGCMLAEANLGYEFWGYAVLATAHIINRMPSRAHEGKRPVEIWGGIKPSIGHLRVLGCPAHVLVPVETRRKLDPKSVRCLFIGYCGV